MMDSRVDVADAAAMVAAYGAAVAFLLPPMLSTPLLPGIDGPYYVVQVEWLLRHGALKYPDPPLAFLLLAAFYLVLRDPFMAVKLGSTLLTALSTVPVYLLVRRATGSRVAGVAAGLAVAVNPFTVKLYSDFVKNAVGLVWLNLFILYEYLYAREPSRGRLAGLLAALALTALTHILDYGVALFYAVTMFLASLALRRGYRETVPGAAAGLLSLAVLVAAPWLVGGDVGKGFAFLAQLVEAEPEQLVMRQYWFPFALGVAAALLAHAYASRGEWAEAALSTASALLAVLVNLPLLPGNWLFRFRLMTGVPLAHAVGFTLPRRGGGEAAAAAALALALLLAVSLPATAVVRPSIPPPAYRELGEAVARCEAVAGRAVVPEVRLRYWAETLSEDVVGARRGGPPPAGCLVLLRNGRRPVPPGIRVYDGRYIVAVMAAGRRP